jgi:hypothetical protein
MCRVTQPDEMRGALSRRKPYTIRCHPIKSWLFKKRRGSRFWGRRLRHRRKALAVPSTPPASPTGAATAVAAAAVVTPGRTAR